MELNQENFDVVVNTMLDFKKRIAVLEDSHVPKKASGNKRWTTAEINWLTTNANEYSNSELSVMIQQQCGTPRTESAIRLKGKALGLWNSTKKTSNAKLPF